MLSIISRSLPRKRRSRKDSLPYALSFFLFFVFILYLNHFLSRATTHDSATSTVTSRAALNPSVRSGGDYGDLCENGIFSNRLSLLFIIPIIIFCFIGLAIVTDDYFISALEQICERLKLSEDVAGATFMAAGSSTPEFFSSMIGTFITKDEVGLGTIVGSAVFNILIIIGLSAALAGSVLHLDWRPLIRDSLFYVLSIVLLFIFTFVSSKGVINWWEGLILVCAYGAYIVFMAFGNKPYMKFAAKLGWFGITPESDEPENDVADIENNAAATGNIEAFASVDNIPPATSQNDLRHYNSSAANMEQPAPRRVTSQATLNEDGTPRYRDLHLRTRLRAAQMSVIAIERMKNDVKRRQSSADGSEGNGDGKDESGSQKDVHLQVPDVGKDNAQVEDVGDGDEEEKKQFLGVDLPESIVGKILYPFTFTWKILYRYTIIDCSKAGREKYWPITFITAILWISGVSYGMVELTRIAGCLLNIPATAMGLTVLAAGTSIPDALASISVARDGAGDMAVSNAIGSNVFDILLGLGVPWFLGDLILSTPVGKSGPISIQTDPITEVIIPIIILFSIMVAFLAILIALKWTMKPLLGYLLCGLYLVFVTYTLLDVYVFKFGGE